MKNNISVVINTLNEEENIEACITSLKDLADEIVVCDMYSDDKTVAIAERLGAKVVYHKRTGFVEPARHYAISQASNEWVLVLDADERMTMPLANKLRKLTKEDNVKVVSFWSLFWYFGGWVRYGGFYGGFWTRFFRKRAYLESYNKAEEQVHHNFSALSSYPMKKQLSSEFYIEHIAYPNIEKYVNKTLGKYAFIEAEQYYKQGKKFTIRHLIGEPIKQFIKRFFLMRGYRDGVRGLILAVLYSCYRFVVWANVWQLEEQNKENN